MENRLSAIREFQGKLIVLGSGLRIGGSGDIAGIGETDNPIIRNPITKLPYVPGSSIKGKMRSLLEMKHGAESRRAGSPCECGYCTICQLFGCGEIRNVQSPTRLIFRDCPADEETKEIWDKAGINSEVKTEVQINRKDLKANPRSCERIPADSYFDFNFSLRIFEKDDMKKIYGALAEGFDLVEKDYLGGYGSRGYGKVEFSFDDGSEDGISIADHLRAQANEVGGV